MSLIKRICGRKFNVSPDSPVLTSNKSGILVENSSVFANEGILKSTNLKIVRVPLFLSLRTKSDAIDQYIADGFLVQMNIDWSPSVTPTAFPTDMTLYSSRLHTCLDYYSDRFASIPLFICENEWDNETYHTDVTGTNYAIELDTFNTICHGYGLKTADGGFSSNNVRRWTYSKLSGQPALDWKSHYFVGLSNDYANFLIRMNSYLDAISSINYDYQNIHWYNKFSCYGGFSTALGFVKEQTLKDKCVSNEFGIDTNSFTLFQQTINEIKNDIDYAIAYSGINTSGKPITLSNQMLSFLAQTIK